MDRAVAAGRELRRLAEDYCVAAEFAQTRLVYVEKPVGAGSAVEEMAGYFFGTVGLRVEPGEPDSGVVFGLGVELGSLPLSFHKAIEETVRATLRQGLYGWEVTDIVVTLSSLNRLIWSGVLLECVIGITVR